LSQRAGQRLCSSRRSELCLPVPFALISRTFWRPLKSMIILCDFGTVIIFASSDPAPLWALSWSAVHKLLILTCCQGLCVWPILG
jgi:hypothetical protein